MGVVTLWWRGSGGGGAGGRGPGVGVRVLVPFVGDKRHGSVSTSVTMGVDGWGAFVLVSVGLLDSLMLVLAEASGVWQMALSISFCVLLLVRGLWRPLRVLYR